MSVVFLNLNTFLVYEKLILFLQRSLLKHQKLKEEVGFKLVTSGDFFLFTKNNFGNIITHRCSKYKRAIDTTASKNKSFKEKTGLIDILHAT